MGAVGNIRLDLFSNNYYKQLEEFSQSGFETAKLLGQFYTNYSVVGNMVGSLVDRMAFPYDRLSIIDPFCGDGRLIIELLKAIATKAQNTEFEIVIWDVDDVGLQTAKENIQRAVNTYGLTAEIHAEKTDSFAAYYDYQAYFDICITNPPWSILKPQKHFAEHHSKEEQGAFNEALSHYDSYLKEEFSISQPTKKFGKWGTNMARCGVEVALRLVKENGYCAVVSPASLLSDQVSSCFRKWIFENYSLFEIDYYSAEAKLFGSADIASITMILQAKQNSSNIILRLFDGALQYQKHQIDSHEFAYIQRNGYVFPLEAGIELLPLLATLEELPTLEKCTEVIGLKFGREIDETRIQERLCPDGDIIFTKGYMVDRYELDVTPMQYIDPGKIKQIPESVNRHKIVWRDVSRNTQKRRIKATIIPPGFIAGNSLGIAYLPDEDTDKLKHLLAIINSLVFEIQARAMLVTNHVSSGVLKKVHVPYNAAEGLAPIAVLVDRRLSGDNSVDAQLECEIAKAYGLDYDTFKTVVEMFMLEEAERNAYLDTASRILKRKDAPMIFNHYASKLSDLDMQIISHVPQGGNWKNIPESVPSQRLAQIRQSYKEGKGSRSTYYGRLRSEMPAYTINTYFTRPGNGCNIHYEQDRTLSQREAARLQSFPDSFEFEGSIASINTQIGNAVPPLLAFQIAKAIPFQGMFVDLFSGAGGLALGFTWAGWKPVIANDIDARAIATHKRNLPGEAIVGDINSEEVINVIVAECIKARMENPDLPLFVIGGPPCQGFSTANTRRGADDMRNWLFKAYVNILRRIQPDGFVFENVKGMLNLDKGAFFKMITSELKATMEDMKVNVVNSAHYGIPQRRERVIVVGGTSEFVRTFNLPEVTSLPGCTKCNSELPPVPSVSSALADLPPIAHAEDGSAKEYLFDPQTSYQKLMRGYITPEEYLKNL